MPVTRPAYGRKLQPFVTAPDTQSKAAKAKSAKKAAEDAALAAAVFVATTPPVS